MSTEIKTRRTHRTWLEKVKLWQCAYETKVCDSHREIVGRGSTPETSRDAACRLLERTDGRQTPATCSTYVTVDYAASHLNKDGYSPPKVRLGRAAAVLHLAPCQGQITSWPSLPLVQMSA